MNVRTIRRTLAHTVVAIAATALLATSSPATAATTYAAPYESGPSGGDQYNHIEASPDDGTVTVLRANPTPGAISCGGSGGFAYLRVAHPVTASVTSAVVAYDAATTSPFTWISVEARDSTGYIGSGRIRGPMAADAGRLVVTFDRAPVVGDTLTVDFGLQVASACPNVDGGTVHFPEVSIR